MAALRLIGWAITVIYSTIPCLWLVVHPRARKLGRAKAPLFVVGPIWFGMWLVMGVATWPWRHLLLYDDTGWSWLGAAPIFVTGFLLYVLAFRRFTTDQVLGRTELQPQKHEQRLVTAGIRERMRHPLYAAHFLEMLAWSIGTGMAALFAMTAFAVLTGLFMIRAEDRELEQRFGDEYRAYRERVPALIPRIR